MKNLIFIPFFVLFSIPSFSQQVRSVDEQQHLWIVLNGNTTLSNKFSVFHDFQLRRDDYGASKQQLLFRGGLTYKISEVVQVTAGYGYIITDPYGGFPVTSTFPEHRIWEQIQLRQPLGKTNLTHRYRLEQRMIGNSTTGEFNPYRYENRIRYMGRLVLPIYTDDDRKLSTVLYDEIFVNFGKNVGRNIFDQNRLFIGFNYRFSEHISIEAGYMDQFLKQKGLTPDGLEKFENNHTLIVTKTLNF